MLPADEDRPRGLDRGVDDALDVGLVEGDEVRGVEPELLGERGDRLVRPLAPLGGRLPRREDRPGRRQSGALQRATGGGEEGDEAAGAAASPGRSAPPGSACHRA